MRFVLLSDTHTYHDKVKVPNGDVLLFAGDACGVGSYIELIYFTEFLSKLPHKYKIMLPGNHDRECMCMNPLHIMPPGVSYLCDNSMRIHTGEDILNVYGMPWVPAFSDWAFMLPRHSDKLNNVVNMIPDTTDILITHGPPRNILDSVGIYDEINNEKIGVFNTGCAFLRKRVNKVKPKLHVFGHIHDEYGTLRKNGTLFVNACICTEKYKPTNPPIVLDYIKGEFILI